MVIAVALALAACGQPAGAPDAEKGETAPALTATPNAATLQAYAAPLRTEQDLAQNVARVIPLEREGAKLYSLVGGDPAINGDYALLGFYTPPDGWKAYLIGDFNTWELVEQSADRIVLQVNHSVVDQASGEIVTAVQRIAVALPPPDSEPNELQVTPVN
jgi:hypothetical protein